MNATLAKLTRLAGDPPAGDGPLLDAFLAGDQSAFAVLVRRHAGLVFATCRRVLRHEQDAEDAFQATFLVLARRAADVWPREAVASWLFGVAHRVALKARTARSRRAGRERPLEDVASEDTPPDFDLAETVHRVVCRLPEVYRAAVVACDLEGLSRKEAAERLGWSEGTLSGRLARARELLAHRFRRAGLSLPAGGLATVCAVPECASAAVQTTIDLATRTAGVGASAQVSALTEGVVRSMALIKLKAMTAAVFAACAIGFGAFAASGAGGNGAGADGQQKQTQTQGAGAPAAPAATKPDEPPAKAPARPTGPRVELARQELEVFLQDVELMAIAGKLDKATLDRLRGRIRGADQLLDARPGAAALTDSDRLQGTWRIDSLTEGGKTTLTNPKDPWVVEVTSRTIRMPYLETEGGWKQRASVFAVNEVPSPRTIDLIAPNKPVGHGIYEFTLPASTCAACHANPFEFKGVKPPLPEALGACGPALKDQLKMRDAGLRLAISIDGKRPTKFGGAGVIVLEMTRADALKTADPNEDVRIAVAALAAAQAQLAQAEAEHDIARANVAQAQAVAEQHAKKLQIARDRVEAAAKAVLDSKPQLPPAAPAKDAPAFTLHVRTLTAAEKVTRVRVAGADTVMAGLVHAAEDVSLKADALSVWLVRDKAVLRVDLPAILKGDANTNYALKSGDQLFVQAKPAK